MQKINVGFIGFGASGQIFHAPILSSVSGFEIKKIKTSSPENINHAVSLYPQSKTISDNKEIFNDPEIDLVVIVTPNNTHTALVKEALLHGKHVVVDKPFTVTSEEADELIALAQKQQKILTVYHNRRLDSDFKTIRKVIQSETLGNIAEVEIHFDRFRNYVKEEVWKEQDLPGSGILYDLGSHLIDQAIQLFGLPDELFADIRVQRTGGVTPDNFELLLYYGSLKVTLKAGMLVKEPGPRYTLLGDKGSFIKYGLDVQEEILKAGGAPRYFDDWGEEPEAIWGTINTEINGLKIQGKVESEKGDYREFYQNLYQAIINGADLLIKPEQASDIIRIIELAIQSSQEKRVVKFEK